MAYELAYGPLDHRYANESQAAIHEQLQTLNYMFGAANFTDEKKNKKNPVPEPQRYPRPGDLLYPAEDDDEE
ncbi:hypothetical protein [Streptomyces sp. NPDC015131]|uniref:hypothetical protein n=1 Tax=Streptomyces sp. NPDC015131 TaxID=3364941 RepID=UPI0036FCCE4E